MLITLKEFTEGGCSAEDIHTEVRQIKRNDSYFVEDAKEAVIDTVMEYYGEIADIFIDRTSLERLYDGELKQLIFHPGRYTEEGEIKPCKQISLSNGLIDYENTVIFTKQGEGICIFSECEFGKMNWKTVYTAFRIKEEDLCFGVVGSIYKGLKYGGTINRIVHLPFQRVEEAERYFENTIHTACYDYSEYAVEVFSRSHLIQTTWYKKSVEELGLMEEEREL